MTTNPDQIRRYDLDWLRIIAFGLLIFYHTGMFYVTWDWHVKSDHASHLIEPLMLLVNPWRLELLFFISGVAARFMIDKAGAAAFAWARFNRLFWPLVFGMAVIVPPQTFYQIVSHGYHLDYLDFWGKYLTHFKGWCDADGCLTVPTWNHLWYVAYLLPYCLILAVLWPFLKRLPLGLLRRLPAPVYFVVPVAVVWAARAWLMPLFGESHAFVGDWYVHAVSFGFFIAGVAVAKFDRFFEIARKTRYSSLALALLAYGVLILAKLRLIGGHLDEDTAVFIGKSLQSQQAVLMIMALIGFARQSLAQADGPVRRALTEAIFPFYIVHQTIIVVTAYNLNRLHWSVAVEAPVLILTTLAGCWLTYVAVRRIASLRPFFGLKFRES